MSSPSSSRVKCRQISLHEIISATDNFDERYVLGHGGEGKVYLAKIQLGDADDEITRVAVKQLKPNCQEFDKEINTISMIQHPNIVSLLGYCNESGQKILLYEYMEKGSLSDYVRVKKTSISLSWLQRIHICLDSARGLQHLHAETSENPKGIIHRDVKPDNILLGNDFVAKISDFGMFKLSNVGQVQSTMITNLKGTSGYYAPEYIIYHSITRGIDVYAFGVVMFQVLCLKMPWDRGDESYYSTDDEDLGIWAQKNVDADIKAEISDDSLKEFTGIIGSALKKDPKKRPTINSVVLMLEKVLKYQEREDEAKKRLAARSEDHTTAGPQGGASSIVSKTGEYNNAIVLDIGQGITKAGLSIQYTPMDWFVGSRPEGVSGTSFPLRRGGKVVLYQDAHVDDHCMPRLRLDQGLEYVHGDCWRDMYKAIMQARRLIYITGWSVCPSVQLVRDDENVNDSIRLGDLLKTKSQEGVRVLLLVCNDPLPNHDGVMQTGGEETRRFFKHSSVQVLLCPRSAGKGHSSAKQKEVGTICTQDQKTVIVDADAGNYRRRIIAFVGGLDLCVGRYDTPKHSLFNTLQTVHKDDFHNPNYTGPTAGCPREPWHDLHSRIEGPAVYDVLTNFEERWLKASKPKGLLKMKTSSDDALLKLERIPDILGVNEAQCVTEHDPEGWHVQIFDSIPKDSQDASCRNLISGIEELRDMSIHTAYVKAIRAAQHFIYIENEYFLGSYNWSNYKDIETNNLIPMEIALKIVHKIRTNERFCAYIVIPMWPEGIPTSTPTQRILLWQCNTMQMMYETIYKALEEMGLENHYEPQDYLNFFCLGNREVPSEDTRNGGSSNSMTPQALSRKNRRFMIYVHSKGMIVDDEFVILGSANINQQFLEGTRDTEIAMGAYQPHHSWGRQGSSPHGQVYGYRMSLWAEHTGMLEDCFERPESLECVRRVRAISELNWCQFAAEQITEMGGHLLKYPVEVNRKGKVRPLPGCPTFPDVGGTIVGIFTDIQENLHNYLKARLP